ncbi:MAG: hypothetical protein ABIO39_01100 [Caulobacteraceae bacterium]
MNPTAAKPALRTVAVVLAVAAAVLIPVVQMTQGLGLSQRDFAADGDSTLRAAGYAFSIWGVIYAGLIAYAVYQALPSTAETPLLHLFGWPSAVATLGCGLWIAAAAADAKWATVAIIFTSAGALLRPLLQRSAYLAVAEGRDRRFVLWPLGLLAGWLTIASALNLLTVLTAEGLIPPLMVLGWANGGIVVVAATALYVTGRTRLPAYPIPIAWGLAAVFVAERQAQPTVGWLALAAAIAVAVASIWAAMSRRRA